MAAAKLHVFRGDNDGTAFCDFRGENFIGKEQGDHHRTLLEEDPLPEDLIDEVLFIGPRLNVLLQRFAAKQPGEVGKLATMLGLDGDGPVGLRIGLWDE